MIVFSCCSRMCLWLDTSEPHDRQRDNPNHQAPRLRGHAGQRLAPKGEVPRRMRHRGVDAHGRYRHGNPARHREEIRAVSGSGLAQVIAGPRTDRKAGASWSGKRYLNRMMMDGRSRCPTYLMDVFASRGESRSLKLAPVCARRWRRRSKMTPLQRPLYLWRSSRSRRRRDCGGCARVARSWRSTKIPWPRNRQAKRGDWSRRGTACAMSRRSWACRTSGSANSRVERGGPRAKELGQGAD